MTLHFFLSMPFFPKFISSALEWTHFIRHTLKDFSARHILAFYVMHAIKIQGYNNENMLTMLRDEEINPTLVEKY